MISTQKHTGEVNSSDIVRAMNSPAGSYSPEKLQALISPAAEDYLEEMAQTARQLTIQRFGKTIRLYAPLYLSNYCVNNCLYCGFNKDNKYQRRRLTIEQAVEEADIIASEGFRDILLVSSEDRESISVDYLCELAGRLRGKFSSISIEVYQMTTEEYAKLFAAGIEGVTLYQETYDRDVYRKYHPAGPKADYDHRLSAADSIAQAGMREIGIGALLGLSDWRLETLSLGEHAHYLMKRYWKSRVSLSFPRLRPAKNVDRTQFSFLSDKNLVQMIVALRLCFADAGMVLSTRERAELRDHLIEVGVTKVSAGSKTSPGGYSQSRNAADSTHSTDSGQAGSPQAEQFEIDDTRSPAEVAGMIRARGFEPVWKDWDSAFAKR